MYSVYRMYCVQSVQRGVLIVYAQCKVYSMYSVWTCQAQWVVSVL